MSTMLQKYSTIIQTSLLKTQVSTEKINNI